MHIAYVRPYPGELDLVKTALPQDTVIATNDITDLTGLTDEERQAIEVLSVFVDYQVTRDNLVQLPNLKCIATRSAGFDHINMAAAQDLGITVCRVPHYGTRTVAEYAIALMFALSRNAFRAYDDMRQRSDITDLSGYEGFDLCGKTLGVVGTGAIGRSVCRIARGIGMHVLAYDVTPDAEFASEVGVTYGELDEVLASAHIVTLHVPSIPATHHLINEERLAQMQPGSYLINTARGEIVDTRALVAALRSGEIAGAGLDVLEGEHALREEAELLTNTSVDPTTWATLVADHALIDMPNVIVTPHIAFNTKEAKREITDITIDNIRHYQAGSPRHTVTV
jgi:D-lactate dehydrogenase